MSVAVVEVLVLVEVRSTEQRMRKMRPVKMLKMWSHPSSMR
jgi:hypothetical protein